MRNIKIVKIIELSHFLILTHSVDYFDCVLKKVGKGTNQRLVIRQPSFFKKENSNSYKKFVKEN